MRLTEADFAEARRRTDEQRFVRGPATRDGIAALTQLHDQLVSDASLYLSDELQDQRDAVAHALLAVTDYLMAQGFSHHTLAPIVRPAWALAERENNSLDLMFTQRAREGRPKATSAEHERTGILAALTEAWLRIHESTDRSQSQKLSEAARVLKGRWFGTVTPAKLKRAREFVSQEAKDHPAVTTCRMFYGYVVRAVEMFGAEEGFRVMIRTLNDRKLPYGGGEGGISKTPPV